MIPTEDINTEDSELVMLCPSGWQIWAKRFLDITIAALALVMLSPLLLVIAIIIKLKSPGPVFFRWHVIGQHGKPFFGYKFRTMYDGADRVRHELADKNEMSGVFFKMRDDPRVTPVGRILRRYSIDEFPQLWNILKGSMSLVGPRPTQTFEFEQLEPWQKRRIQVKPGAVSSWIVNGKTRNFNQIVREDLEYIDNWNIGLDLKILFKSVPHILFGKNC